MAQLSNKIREYCKANGVADVDFLKDVKLQDDSNGQGVYIKEWNLDIAQPTDAQLASYETVANQTETEIANEKQAKENAKASGNQKLLDLGLTQAEATALTGYTPPTEV